MMTMAWGSLAWQDRAQKAATFPAVELRPRPAPARQLSPSFSNPNTAKIASQTTNIATTTSPVATGSAAGETQLQATAAKRPKRTGVSSTSKARGRHICSICAQAFARAEHLTRHERAHRNERPFSCKHCDAQFTRKDLVKRHIGRYHRETLETEKPCDVSNESRVLQPSVVSVSTAHPAPMVTAIIASESPENGSDGRSPMQQDPMDTVSNAHNNLNHAQQDPKQQNEILLPTSVFDIDAFMMDMSSQFSGPFTPRHMSMELGRYDGMSPNMMGDMHFENQTGDGGMHHVSQPVQSNTNLGTGFGLQEGSPIVAGRLDFVISGAPSISALQPQQSSWRGSFEASEAKRADILHNVKEVFSLARVDDAFKLPSSIALERYITTFFDAFIIHLPCIHVPTWRAEAAHPSVILGMAALGANFHYESALAHSLHRAARLSIINFLELSSFTSKNRPAWVMQSLFITMAFGVWSGKFAAVQEALAFQANLAHIVRYVEYPCTSWGASCDGPSLSWEEWVGIEEIKRTKLVVYAFFNNLTMVFNIPPALVNSEVDIDLPCTEAEWTAATPQAWAEYRKHSYTPAPTFSRTLQSLLSPLEPYPEACSTFGSYIMIHALLQHIWRISQVSTDKASELAALEPALRKWQGAWEANVESSLSPRNPHGPLAFNSSALLRLGYIRLIVDFGRLKSVVMTQRIDAISQSMKTHMTEVKRSLGSTKAALYAIDALRIPVKLGMNIVVRTGSLVWSLQHHLFSFECCLFLSKWLEAIHAPGAEFTWTEDERQVETLVTRTLEEVELGPVKSAKPKSAQLMYVWSKMFDCLEVWGIIPILGSSFSLYADSIGEDGVL